MRSLKKIISVLALTLVLSLNLTPLSARQAQVNKPEAQSVEMADTFRQEGKIYVVVAVVLLILGGLVVYTASIDKKLRRLEKELEIHD